jgi:transcriptional regulator with XRE-family HTH domain
MNLSFNENHHFQSKPEKYCDLGKQIDAKLTEIGISKNQFSKAIGISASYLTHIMLGHYNDSPQIPRILKALNSGMAKIDKAPERHTKKSTSKQKSTVQSENTDIHKAANIVGLDTEALKEWIKQGDCPFAVYIKSLNQYAIFFERLNAYIKAQI